MEQNAKSRKQITDGGADDLDFALSPTFVQVLLLFVTYVRMVDPSFDLATADFRNASGYSLGVLYMHSQTQAGLTTHSCQSRTVVTFLERQYTIPLCFG